MRVGQKAQDRGTLQYSGLDTGNSEDFFFPGLGFLPSSPIPWSISRHFLKPRHPPSILSRTDFHPFLLELPKKCRRGEDKRGRPISWLMQRRIICSTQLYESLHYWPCFPGELLGYKFQPAAPDPWLTELAFCKVFNIRRTEGGSACRVQCRICSCSGSPWNTRETVVSASYSMSWHERLV